MKTMKAFLMIAGLVSVSAAFLAAQMDPPNRAGRLNYINGPVSFQPAGVTDWVDATINRPLTTGDHIWVGDGGQAEIHVGSTALRLNSNTAFQFLNLDDQTAQIQLSQGTLTARVRNFGQGQNFEIDTPSLAFTLLRPGEYRMSADPDSQTTTVTVRDGDGEVTGGGQTFPVHTRQQAIVTGGDQITYNVESAPRPDAWDQWSDARDGREDRSPSARYVSREVPGYDDLDQNGQWQSEPGYGQVWRPSRVARGWAPYHDGNWVWVAPWGWTWVDDQPWGYAPSHYGRWASFNDGWGWVPGPLNVTPYYAPALVGWVGGGRGGASFSVGFSFGNAAAVGWFPLGPRDPYIPGYNTSQGYFNRVNNTNTTINNTNITNYYNDSRNSNNTITNVKYVNQNVPNAVIAVPQNSFANGRSVAQTARPVPASQLATAHFAAAAGIAPQQASVLGARASTASSAPRPPASAFSRPVVARTAPPPPPVAFSRQQAALAQNPGRPLPPATVQQMRQTAPATNSPVRVVNMAQVQRVQPTMGAGPQGARQTNPQSPNLAQRPNAVPPPAANNRPGAPVPNASAKPNVWSAPVARPGAPSSPSNANARQQYSPPPNTAPAPAQTNRPGGPVPNAGAKPNAWSAPVARPGAPSSPSNANARQQYSPPSNAAPAPAQSNRPGGPVPNAGAKPNAWSAPVARPAAPSSPSSANARQQNSPAQNVEQPSRIARPPATNNRPSQAAPNATAKPNTAWSAPVARPEAPGSNANARPNTPPPQRPSAFPPATANNRPSAPPPTRQQPAQSQRTAVPPQQSRPQQPPPQAQRSQPAERPQAVRPHQPESKQSLARTEPKPNHEKDTSRPNN